ncbi:hypothetical protein WISP_55527 [Willisornis vidua]|uniref:Uncharacterized protein n=1 Tax=Willisornis vidua TaxID=1566151 RepID=A0ABQ9DI38_9PASS|nr:hypothetical protein WISP_55527 [Willisornis vidua]
MVNSENQAEWMRKIIASQRVNTVYSLENASLLTAYQELQFRFNGKLDAKIRANSESWLKSQTNLATDLKIMSPYASSTSQRLTLFFGQLAFCQLNPRQHLNVSDRLHPGLPFPWPQELMTAPARAMLQVYLSSMLPLPSPALVSQSLDAGTVLQALAGDCTRPWHYLLGSDAVGLCPTGQGTVHAGVTLSCQLVRLDKQEKISTKLQDTALLWN